MPIFSLRKMRWRQSSHETTIELTAHYSCILHKSIGRLKHNPTEIAKLEFIYEMTKIKVKRLKMVYKWSVLFFKSYVYLNYSFPIKGLCYDPCESTECIAPSHSLSSSAPSSLPRNHELLLFHIRTAKAEYPHFPLTGMLEMEKTNKQTSKQTNTQKIKDKTKTKRAKSGVI